MAGNMAATADMAGTEVIDPITFFPATGLFYILN